MRVIDNSVVVSFLGDTLYFSGATLGTFT